MLSLLLRQIISYHCHLSLHTIALFLLVTSASGSAHLSPCSPCLSLCSLTVAGDKHTTIPTALSRSKTSGGHFIMPSSLATSSRSLSCLHPHSLLCAFLLISVKIWENFTDSQQHQSPYTQSPVLSLWINCFCFYLRSLVHITPVPLAPSRTLLHQFLSPALSAFFFFQHCQFFLPYWMDHSYLPTSFYFSYLKDSCNPSSHHAYNPPPFIASFFSQYLFNCHTLRPSLCSQNFFCQNPW